MSRIDPAACYRLDGRVILVTGAARGQGAETSRLLHALGARVVLADVVPEVESVAAELDNALAVHLDVSDEHAWAAAVTSAEERFGKLDGLVNNAGVMALARLTDTTVEEFWDVVRVNQLGVFLGLRACGPRIAAAGGGSVVNVSSVGGRVGMFGLSAYTASKFAVLGLTRTAALEWPGVRVNALLPGVIDTAMTAGMPPEVRAEVAAGLPARRLGSATEMARATAFLLSDASAFCTGTELVADGGQLAGSSVH